MAIIAEPHLNYAAFQKYPQVRDNVADLLQYMIEKEIDGDPAFDYFSMAHHVVVFMNIEGSQW
jgi:hypothetical protein